MAFDHATTLQEEPLEMDFSDLHSQAARNAAHVRNMTRRCSFSLAIVSVSSKFTSFLGINSSVS
jgi:hypothetical protein